MIKRKAGLLISILIISIIMPVYSVQTENKLMQTSENTEKQEKVKGLDAKAYKYLQYIDSNLSDRDCINGDNYTQAQQWIKGQLKKAGYNENDIHAGDFTFQKKTTGSKTNTYTAKNIWVTKKGTRGKQIIIGAHYDGTGTGDNGSGFALALAAATAFHNVSTYYDLTFVFFSAEEYGLSGSSSYAANMTKNQIDRTKYMINIDSIISGDYCYIYGGVADFDNKIVNKVLAYKNAMKTAQALGLNIKANPWTFKNPEPSADNGIPRYPSPSTGDWGDHVAFRDLGIEYVYFEATNWEIGDYDGYSETKSFGPIMNTNNDYLKKIESLFPGRPEKHLRIFSTLLKALLEQSNYPN